MLFVFRAVRTVVYGESSAVDVGFVRFFLFVVVIDGVVVAAEPVRRMAVRV